MSEISPEMPKTSHLARTFGCILILPLSFRVFQFFPGMALIQEGWFVLSALTLVTTYLPWRCRNGGRLSGLEIYICILTILIPVWSAFASERSFGQPIIFGLLAHRGMVLVAWIPFATHFAIQRNLITLKNLEKALIALAWATLLIFTGMHYLLDAGSYHSKYGLAFVSGSGPEAMFKFNVIFIIFGFYYYGFKGFRDNSLINYFYCLLFFLFLLLVIHGRSLLVALIAVFLFMTAVWTKNRVRLILFLIKTGIAITILWAILYFTNHEFYNNLISKFSDAFTVLFTGELTDDASANARITESALAIPYIIKHFFAGNGLISSQWNGGWEEAMLGYFYPDDIGILGVIFLYGSLGTLLYSYQFKLAVSYSRNINNKLKSRYQAIIDASKGVILYFGVRSLATAQFVYTPEPLIFFIAILWVLHQANSNQDHGCYLSNSNGR